MSRYRRYPVLAYEHKGSPCTETCSTLPIAWAESCVSMLKQLILSTTPGIAHGDRD